MRVFVSATSSDLREARAVARQALLTHDIHPVDQESFPPDERPLTEYLNATVGRCDAVLCLIGYVFGAAPHGQTQLRSYTQLEYDYAQKLGKPVFVFKATEQFCMPVEQAEDSERQRLQLEHREKVEREHKCELFDSLDQLELRLAYAGNRMLKQAGRVPLYFRHLPPAPPWFEGRDEECQQLHDALHRDSPSVIAVVGIGGQGKTTLTHRVLRDCTDLEMDGGYWCTAHSSGFTFEMFLDDALHRLTEGKFDKWERPSLQQRVTELLAIMQSRKVLIVIDGLEHWLRGGGEGIDRSSLRAARHGTLEELDQFLVQASGLNSGSHLVVTTRVLPVVLDQVDLTTIPVSDVSKRHLGLVGLAPGAAVSLMIRLGVRGDKEELARIAKRFAYHPMALKIVSSYVVEEYFGDLNELDSLEDVSPETSLVELFRQVEAKLPAREESTRLLQTAAHSFDAPTIEAIKQILQGDSETGQRAGGNVRRLLASLARFQLLSLNDETRSVHIHPLVKEHFAATVEADDAKQIHDRYRSYYESLKVSARATSLEDIASKSLAIQHALSAESASDCVRILFAPVIPGATLLDWFRRYSHFSEGASLLQRVAEIEVEAERPSLLIARSAFCLPIGRIDDAITDLNQAIEILNHSKASTQRDADLGGALINRGDAHRMLFQYDAALCDFDRAIDILQHLAEQEERYVFYLALATSSRGLVFRETGHLRRAVNEFNQAIDIYRARLSDELNKVNDDLASVMLNRGSTYVDLHELDLAIESYSHARDIYQVLLDAGRFEFAGPSAQIEIAIANTYQRQHNYMQALFAVEEPINAIRQLVEQGQTHFQPTLAFGLMTRAVACVGIGQHEIAMQDSQHAKDMLEQMVNAGRVDLSGQLTHARLAYALCRFAFGRIDEGNVEYSIAMDQAKQVETPAVRPLFIRYALAIGGLLKHEHPTAAAEKISQALGLAEKSLLSSPYGTEGMRVILSTWFADNRDLDALQQLGSSDRERIERLQKVVGPEAM